MITINVDREAAPRLRLLLATARDLHDKHPYSPEQLQAQAELIVAACGLEQSVMLSLAAAIRDYAPVNITSTEPVRPQWLYGDERPTP
jgi:hypothetical protein